jgi:hypothetical protein
VDSVMAVFKRLFDQNAERRAEDEARMRRYEEQAAISAEERRAFTASCRPATAQDYAAWLIGYLQSGREPSSLVDGNLSDRGVELNGSLGPGAPGLTAREADPRWWVLTKRPRRVPSLYGAHALNVIVPETVRLRADRLPDTFHGRPGHSTFYFMKDFGLVGHDVPVYVDVFLVIAEQMGWDPDPRTWKAPQAIAPPDA